MYSYDDEDNAPMNDEAFDRIDQNGHNPTVYTSYAEMKAAMDEAMAIPFNDPPADGCWNCMNFDWKHEACTIRWNNLDESYYNPDIDDREPTDYCEDHDKDESVKWEDWTGD